MESRRRGSYCAAPCPSRTRIRNLVACRTRATASGRQSRRRLAVTSHKLRVTELGIYFESVETVWGVRAGELELAEGELAEPGAPEVPGAPGVLGAARLRDSLSR